ncbi:MAG: SUMF1/EgtB/PvdO family nonheme iron enzyme [Myxococcales bacterium]|nr:SUMF1/EgtB/PvdO family nonheme iron enzyme [Myxococcales bacterium]MCB9714495.1 SUMF1/EgtB/PvdO family nonheme iron enzyme [Myxococcales bacterium]
MIDPHLRLARATGALVLSLGLLACDKGEGTKDEPESAEAAKPDAEATKTPADAKTPDAKTPTDAKTPDAKTEPAKTEPAGPCPEGAALVEGGKFFMGSDSEDPILARARPAHQVEVDPVCMDVHEITVAEYKTCVGAGDCQPAFRESWWPQGKTDEQTWMHDKTVHSPMCNDGHTDRLNHPVNCVTWAQAQAYCEHKGGRLPTEAEWEYAARGSDGRVYPWGDEVPDPERANACDLSCQKWRNDNELPDYGVMFDADDGYAGTAPVGSYPKGRTQAGLEDMVGNVFEWTSDRYYEYGKEFQKNPHGPQEGDARVIRGGAFNSFKSTFADPAFRHSMDETAYTHGIGFRCAYEPDAS